MTIHHSEDSSPFRHEIARAVEPAHTFGCAFKQRGGVCDCDLADEGDGPTDVWWAQDGPVIVHWSQREPTRGIDYSRLAEGYWEDDDEGDS